MANFKTQLTAEMTPMIRLCAPIMGALCLLGTPALAQNNAPAILVDLTQQASKGSAPVTTTVSPACSLSTPQASVRVATLLPAAAVTNVDTDSAQVVFSCNTPTALLSISSSGALVNAAPTPTGREAAKFTRRLPFSARADLLDVAQTSGTSSWTLSDNATLGASNLAVGVGTGQRIRTVAVSARGINSQGLIPIAGPYTGSICVGVDPAGVIGTPECAAPNLGGVPQ